MLRLLCLVRRGAEPHYQARPVLRLDGVSVRLGRRTALRIEVCRNIA